MTMARICICFNCSLLFQVLEFAALNMEPSGALGSAVSSRKEGNVLFNNTLNTFYLSLNADI